MVQEGAEPVEREAEGASATAPIAYGETPAWAPGRPRIRPLALLFAWLVSGAALLLAAWLVPGASVNDFLGALFAVAVIAVLNALLPPLIAAVRLPYMLVIGFLLILGLDALMLLAADSITDGDLRIDSFWSALGVALVASALGVALDTLFGTDDDDTYTLPCHPADRAPLGRAGPHQRPRHPVPGDRRARAAGAAARDARRQRADDGELAGRRLAPLHRMGDRPVLADRRQPGRHPARLERGHPGVPLGREGDAGP